MITGVFNSWVIVGSLTGLTGTDYGRLLLVKIVLFLAMLSLAAVNRLRLTPLLRQRENGTASNALSRIRTKTVLEAALGLLVVAVVGLLGTMSPASE